MSVAFRDAFDRRVRRHVEIASERLADAQRQVLAEYARRGLLRSGPRLKRQAQVRREHIVDLIEWCLSEVGALPGDVAANWSEHGHAVTGALTALMADTHTTVLSAAAPFGAAAQDAIRAILNKDDANALAELGEFGSGVWRPRSPRQEISVTSNNVNVGSGSTVGSIQQAGNGAHQQSGSTIDINSVQQALEEFERAVSEAELSEEARSEIGVEIETIRPQLKKAAPSAVIVRESLKTLRNIVEGLAAGALTPQFVALMAAASPLIST